MHSHGLLELFQEPRGVICLSQITFGLKIKIPVLSLYDPTGRHGQSVPWTKLPYLLENRLRSRDVQIGQVIIQRLGVECFLHTRVLQNRFDLGSKQEFVPIPIVIERLNAYPIACQEELLFDPIPNGKSEHPSQMLHTRLAVFLVGTQDDFCITLCCEVVSPLQQGITHSLEVIDLPVKNNRPRLLLIQDRLSTSLYINNTQAPVPETECTIHIETIVVWPTLAQRRAHTLELLWGNSISRLRIQNTSYAAHTRTLCLWSSVIPHRDDSEHPILRRSSGTGALSYTDFGLIQEYTEPHL